MGSGKQRPRQKSNHTWQSRRTLLACRCSRTLALFCSCGFQLHAGFCSGLELMCGSILKRRARQGGRENAAPAKKGKELKNVQKDCEAVSAPF